jgi:ribosomal protein S18 acetylase RimI-like enzyme
MMHSRKAGLAAGTAAATSAAPRVQLLTPESPPQFEATRAIFREYAAGLGVDLCFQNFEAELAALPGEYGAPRGALLLATVNGELAGCGACRALPDVDYANACEMKRLFVRPEARKKGVGRQLAQAILESARGRGYQRVVLDTTPHMKEAIDLYESLGFQRIAAYRKNPIKGALFFELWLK